VTEYAAQAVHISPSFLTANSNVIRRDRSVLPLELGIETLEKPRVKCGAAMFTFGSVRASLFSTPPGKLALLLLGDIRRGPASQLTRRDHCHGLPISPDRHFQYFDYLAIALVGLLYRAVINVRFRETELQPYAPLTG